MTCKDSTQNSGILLIQFLPLLIFHMAVVPTSKLENQYWYNDIN